MTILRGLAILIALFVLAPKEEARAQAGTVPQAELSQALSRAAEQVRHRRQCPLLCTEWFDGCNTCSCGKGFIDVCTHDFCVFRRRPRCLRHGF